MWKPTCPRCGEVMSKVECSFCGHRLTPAEIHDLKQRREKMLGDQARQEAPEQAKPVTSSGPAPPPKQKKYNISGGTIAGGYVLALLMPLFGIIGGIYLAVRSQVAHGIACIGLSFISGFFWLIIFAAASVATTPQPFYYAPPPAPSSNYRAPSNSAPAAINSATANPISIATPPPRQILGQIKVQLLGSKQPFAGHLETQYRITNDSDLFITILQIKVSYSASGQHVDVDDIHIFNFGPRESQIENTYLVDLATYPDHHEFSIAGASTSTGEARHNLEVVLVE